MCTFLLSPPFLLLFDLILVYFRLHSVLIWFVWNQWDVLVCSEQAHQRPQCTFFSRGRMEWLTWFPAPPWPTFFFFPRLYLGFFSWYLFQSLHLFSLRLPISSPLTVPLPFCPPLVVPPSPSLGSMSPTASSQSPLPPLYLTWFVWSLVFFQSETISLTRHNASRETLREDADWSDKWSQLVWLCVCVCACKI